MLRAALSRSLPLVVNLGRARALSSTSALPLSSPSAPRAWDGAEGPSDSNLEGLEKEKLELDSPPWLIQGRVPPRWWSDKANQRLYMDWLSKKLNMTSLNDWYRVGVEDVRQNFGGQLLLRNRNSLFEALITVYTDHEFLPWLFESPLRGIFDSRDVRQKYMDWLLAKLKKKNYLSLRQADLQRNNGNALLEMFSGSITLIVASLRGKAPSAEVVGSARESLSNAIGPKLGITSLEDWHNISLQQLLRMGALPILANFNFSLRLLLPSAFPEFAWSTEKLPDITDVSTVWREPNNVRAVLDHLGESAGIKEGGQEAWYNVKWNEVSKLEGFGILESKRFHFTELVSFAYPEYTWDKNSFFYLPTTLPKKALVDETRELLNELGRKSGLKEGDFTSWYSFPYRALTKDRKFHSIELRFDYSRFKVFSAAFPEHTWYPWLFNKVHKSQFLDTLTGQKNFARYIEKELGLSRPEDWYAITRMESLNLGFSLRSLFPNQSAFIAFLRSVYPEVRWEAEKMAWSTRGSSHLLAALQSLFSEAILTAKDFAKQIGYDLVNDDQGQETIYVIPSAKLVVEYKGPSGYAKQIIEERETLSWLQSEHCLALAARASFTPISVPFWWDRNKDGLLAEIYQARPDLFEPGNVLESHKAEASRSPSIPRTFLLKGFKLNRQYLRHWATLPRFDRFSSTKTLSENEISK